MRAIGGKTMPFAVLGHPIGHTLSPVMHNAAFRALRLDAVYLAFDVHPDRLMGVLPAMADMGFRGVNLTVPLKEVARRGLADLEPLAGMLGAVNTVEFTAGGLRGHNTDGYGFLRAVAEDLGVDSVKGRRVFVLGTGGAGRAVAITCAFSGAARVALADADAARASRVAAEIAGLAPGTEALPVSVADAAGACREADLVVQATPVGMHAKDPSPLGPEAFRAGQAAFDMVYMRPETAFMAAARGAGAAAANGLGMLLHQGARACSIWTGREAPVGVMRQALEAAVYGRKRR